MKEIYKVLKYKHDHHQYGTFECGELGMCSTPYLYKETMTMENLIQSFPDFEKVLTEDYELSEVSMEILSKTDIKKALYREKPLAQRYKHNSMGAWYFTECSLGRIEFFIPNEEYIQHFFNSVESSQLLIRWIL